VQKKFLFKLSKKGYQDMKGKFFLPAACVLILNTGCKSRDFNGVNQESAELQAVSKTEEIPLFDVNDASIMLPPAAFIPMSQRFITDQQFRDVYDAGEGKGPAQEAIIRFGSRETLFRNLRIVSLRYDPCSPGAHAAANIAEQVGAPDSDTVCQGQTRLVAQPLVNGVIADVAFHLIYGLPKTENARRSQLNALAKIKKASAMANAPTDGVSLGVHPGLATGRAEVSQALQEFINLTVVPANIVSVAVTALANDGPEPWVFYAARNVNGKMTATGVPTVEGNGLFQALSFRGKTHVFGKPSNSTVFDFPSLPNLKRQPILARSTDSVFSDPSFDSVNIVPLNQDIVSRIHAIENPRINHFFTMDCVSCHTASTLLMRRHMATLTSKTEGELIKGANNNRCFVPKGTTGYVRSGSLPVRSSFGSPWNTRSFGMFDGHAVVAFRTACEAAEVVQDINERMLSRKQAGPNIGTSVSDNDYKKIEQSIWRCMHFQDNVTYDKCFKDGKALFSIK
jgi:hypothetical protein